MVDRFYSKLEKEIADIQSANEEGMAREQVFTRYCMELLCDAGETENFVPAYFEQWFGTQKQMKINGYAISDNEETVDLFISIYETAPRPCTVLMPDIERAVKRITNFFRDSVYGDLEKTIDESLEIFEFSHALGTYKELRERLIRINVFILTNGHYKGDTIKNKDISGYKLYYRVIDIDYLFQLSKDTHSPIVIDFNEMGFRIPCLQVTNNESSTYNSYIAVITGDCLYKLYEDYGARLLEQNVRSFLQFSGKINRGIRDTILKEPEMFLAYNNGISATADQIELEELDDGGGTKMVKIHNLQIVNGGQTTASIYHTFRDAEKGKKPDLSKVAVQVKLSVIGVKEEYSSIVSNISKNSNTQNKVNDADFSSNNPVLIELERLSRSILTPLSNSTNRASYWYFERVRGQYKTARNKEKILKSREKKFLLEYPEKQKFTKEALAKFVNAYCEVWEGKKLVIGPHHIVKGGQSNFTRFMNNNLPKLKKMDNIFYEDLIAKAILFISVDNRYGTRRTGNAIGDLKNATVPYTISLFNIILKEYGRELNLYKIWKNQCISEALSDFMYKLMLQVNNQIIEAVKPDTNYTERAKKEEIWIRVRDFDHWEYNLNDIEEDLINPQNPPKRISSDVKGAENEDSELIKSLPWSLWEKIEKWGEESNTLTPPQRNAAKEIAWAIKYGHSIQSSYLNNGVAAFNIVFKENPELLEEAEFLKSEEERIRQEKTANVMTADNIEINMDIVKQMVEWDKKHKKLEDWKYNAMKKVVSGHTQLSDRMKEGFKNNLVKLMRYGFKPEK